MPLPPSLFLIGAQKAGTTYLATLLGQHPDVCLSEPKEPHYFTQHWEKGEDWYQACFPRPERRFLLDASPSYSAAPLGSELGEAYPPSRMAHVPERIAIMAPDARFIYLMRDPVGRTYSSYWHSVRAGNEQRSFAEVIRNDSYYLRMGCYFHQLEHYFKHFDRDRFQLLFFEDFIKAPQVVANRCLSWLGLSPMADLRLAQGKNESYTYGPVLTWLNRRLSREGGLKWLTRNAKRIVPHSVLRAWRVALTEQIPPLAQEDREWLADYFAEPNRQLETELGLQLPGWTSRSSVSIGSLPTT